MGGAASTNRPARKGKSSATVAVAPAHDEGRAYSHDPRLAGGGLAQLSQQQQQQSPLMRAQSHRGSLGTAREVSHRGRQGRLGILIP